MTPALPWPTPGGRVLAAWWKQLAPWRPRTAWFGHLILHHIDALVELSKVRPIDQLTQLLLEGVSLAPDDGPEELDARLRLGPPLLARLLRQLEDEGLVRRAALRGWTLTDTGRQARLHGSYPQAHHERRAFHLLHGDAPHFLDVRDEFTVPLPAGPTGGFEAGALQACVNQPPDWKERHRFPADVRAVLHLRNGDVPGAGPAPWRRVALARPERLPALLVLSDGPGGPLLRGFGVRVEGWVLSAEQPAFDLGPGWRDVFPALAGDVPESAWRQAWLSWCQARNLPAEEATRASVAHQAPRLRVRVPAKLFDRLRSTRSDVLKGETWLLAESAPPCPLALLDVVPEA
jgi:hypothetical protein